MTLKIYGVLRSRASRNVWLAKELGLPFEHVPVMQASRLRVPSAGDAPLSTASAAFRAVNPNGLIPAIEDDGLVLSESLAINLYLAKKHGGPLSPRDLREDALMTMWAIWAMTECEPHAVQILFHRLSRGEFEIQFRRRSPSEDARERDPAVAARAVAALRRPFGVLDATLRDGGGHVVGGRFTVSDINVAEVLRYAQPAPELFADHPHVNAWIESCQARPAYRETMAERDRELP